MIWLTLKPEFPSLTESQTVSHGVDPIQRLHLTIFQCLIVRHGFLLRFRGTGRSGDANEFQRQATPTSDTGRTDRR